MDNINESLKKLIETIETQNILLSEYIGNSEKTLNLRAAHEKLRSAKRDIFEKKLLDKLWKKDCPNRE